MKRFSFPNAEVTTLWMKNSGKNSKHLKRKNGMSTMTTSAKNSSMPTALIQKKRRSCAATTTPKKIRKNYLLLSLFGKQDDDVITSRVRHTDIIDDIDREQLVLVDWRTVD